MDFTGLSLSFKKYECLAKRDSKEAATVNYTFNMYFCLFKSELQFVNYAFFKKKNCP